MIESRTIVKLSNQNACSQKLHVKRELKNPVPTALGFPNGTAIYIKESLCPYFLGICNKSKN